MQASEAALVTRPDLDVEIRTLPDGGAAFLCALMDGDTLGVAAEKATGESEAFDFAGNIGGMVQAGVFAGVQLAENK